MSLVRKILARGRLRKARRDLAENPSPMNYAALAKQYAWAGGLRDALRIAQEGLDASPGHPELKRLVARLARVQQEDLIAELREELRESPRPAVWNELCEVLLESKQHARVQEVAQEWYRATRDAEAMLLIATSRVGAYLSDLGREAGRQAFESLEETQRLLPSDLRPLKLRLQLVSAIGAWGEAAKVVQRMLELDPGSLALEARYRSLAALPEGPDVDRALIQVEKTGKLAAADAAEDVSVPVGEVRPLLQRLAVRDHIEAAVYVRGSTALVQGLRGAQAHGTARAVRSILQSGRATARCLGLGQISGVKMEGSFGTLFLAAGEIDAGAIVCKTTLDAEDRADLLNLVGATTPGGAQAA